MIAISLSMSHSRFIDRLWQTFRKVHPSDVNIIPLILDAEIKRYKTDLRDSLYAVMFSDKMKMTDPKISDFDMLNLSVMGKCVLLLSQEGFEEHEMASMLISTKHSIRTLMLNLKKRCL